MADLLYPAYGIMLQPEWSALRMSLTSIIVAVNAVSLKRVEGELGEPRLGQALMAPGSAGLVTAVQSAGSDGIRLGPLDHSCLSGEQAIGPV